MLSNITRWYIAYVNDQIMSKTGIIASVDLEESALKAQEEYGEDAIDEIYKAIDECANEYLNG